MKTTRETSRTTDSKTASTVVFTMGLPAAGKSTWTRSNLSSFTIIDPDAVKEAHSDYNANDPGALHGWSQVEVEKMWNSCLSKGEGNWVVDGTGTNSEKMVRRITQAQAAGYSTELVYVTCSLETSLIRNARRDRHVPEHIIKSKALDISTSFEIVSKYTSKVTVIDNN